MSKNLVYCLPGFLGASSDWDGLKKNIEKNIGFCITRDLFKKESSEILEMEDYVDILSDEIQSEIEDFQATAKVNKVLFVGYSLGGRLGLALLNRNPDLFDHFIFISTNPGYSENEQSEKNKRLMIDMKWASQISVENWDSFVHEWNQQSVFDGSVQESKRLHQNFDLAKLKRALVMWSLSQQEDYRDLIYDFRDQLTWVVGEKDKKYVELAESMKQQKIILDYQMVKSTGHRVHLDNPDALYQIIQNQIAVT